MEEPGKGPLGTGRESGQGPETERERHRRLAEAAAKIPLGELLLDFTGNETVRPLQVVVMAGKAAPVGKGEPGDRKGRSELEVIAREIKTFQGRTGLGFRIADRMGTVDRAALILFLSGLANAAVSGDSRGTVLLLQAAAAAAAAAWGARAGLAGSLGRTLGGFASGKTPMDAAGMVDFLERGGKLYVLDVQLRGKPTRAERVRWNLVVAAPKPVGDLEVLAGAIRRNGPQAVTLNLEEVRKHRSPDELSFVSAGKLRVAGLSPSRLLTPER